MLSKKDAALAILNDLKGFQERAEKIKKEIDAPVRELKKVAESFVDDYWQEELGIKLGETVAEYEGRKYLINSFRYSFGLRIDSRPYVAGNLIKMDGTVGISKRTLYGWSPDAS